MQWWQAVILGLVEGITEYLPVSSTGHLILASSLMGLDTPAHKRAVDAFTIIIQGGAILAVLGLYRQRVVQMLRGLIGKDRAGLRLALAIMVAFIPAGVLGPLLNDTLETHLFHAWPVVAALALGGVYMIALDRWHRRKPQPQHDAQHDELANITWKQALTIGLLQCVAMWPGVSRSMMTITGGVLVGMRPAKAAEFSFLLGLPTLGGATLYALAKNLLASASDPAQQNLFQQLGVANVLIGIAVAAVSAAVAVRWLVAFLNRKGMAVFGWYRIALAAALLALTLAGVVSFG